MQLSRKTTSPPVPQFSQANEWHGLAESKFAIALFPFLGSGRLEIPLEVGEHLKVEEYNAGGWLRGTSLRKSSDQGNIPSKRGIFPTNHVQIGESIESLQRDTNVVVAEMQALFKIWYEELQKSASEDNIPKYTTLRKILVELVAARQRIVLETTNPADKEKLKQEVLRKIAEGKTYLMKPRELQRMAPAATLRGHMASPGIRGITSEFEDGIIALYQKHVDQRTKQSEQLREHKRLSLSPSLANSLHSPPTSPSLQRVAVQNQVNRSNSIKINQSLLPPAGAFKKPVLQKQISKLTLETTKPVQLLVDMKVFMCSTGEPTELRFSLYNADTKKFTTEDFQITLTAHGMPEDLSKIGKVKALFKDLSESDVLGEIYLVCRLVRKGRILPELKGKTKKTTEYRRPFGCAVLKLLKTAGPDSVFNDFGTEKEHTLPIFTSESENDICNLHELIPKGQNLISLPHARGVVLGLTLYRGEVSEVSPTIPDFKDFPQINRLEFPDVIMPGLQRHDFYVTLEAGDNLKIENLEVAIVLNNDDGKAIPAIVPGAGSNVQLDYRSAIIMKEPNPKWKETFNVRLSENDFAKSHLLFTLQSCSDTSSKDKEVAFAFLPLTTADGTVISDAEHSLTCYTHMKDDSAFYLKDTGNNKQLAKLLRKGEQIRVRTRLTSTKLTTDASMLSLRKWRELPREKVPEILNRITYIPAIEILKFLTECFDAMFAILESTQEGVSLLVYNALVFIIGNLLDEKRSPSTVIELRRVLDTYMTEHFSGTMAHKHLMTCLKQYLDRMEDMTQISKIILTFKSLEYVLKIIVTSRLLYMKQQATQSSTEDIWFKKDLLNVFTSINLLMSKTSPTFRGAQANMVKNFMYIIDDLGKIFSPQELAVIIRDFLGSLGHDSSLKLLNVEKINLITFLIASEQFLDSDSRMILMPSIIGQLDHFLRGSSEDEKKECITAVIQMLRIYEEKLKDPSLLQDLIPLVPHIMKAVATLKGQSRLDAITCFLTLFHLMKPEHFESLLQHVKDDEWNFITKIFQNFQSFILAPTYPDSWLPMNMFQYTIILKVATELTNVLIKRYQASPNKNQFFGSDESSEADKVKQVNKGEVWKQFFRLVAFYIQSKFLQGIKWGSEAKQAEINNKCDQMRLDMIKLLKSVWTQIGSHRTRFLNYLMGPFLEFHLIPNQEIQKAASELYFSAIETEYEENRSAKNFVKVETHTIDNLDKLSTKDEGLSEEFTNLFLSGLETRLKEASPDLQSKGFKFVSDIKYFLGLLTALRTLPKGPEYEDDRAVANLKLMEYLKETNRKDAYVRYIHKLVQQHEQSNNYTEAGEALLLHARLYKWSDDKLGEISGEFPAQTQHERKEKLYRRAIEMFDKGKLWERACALIKELRHELQFVTYEYEKLGELLEFQSSLLRKILTEPRFFAEYFRVAFYGKGFDKNISGKTFIYRGLELERRDDFIERMKYLFPNAEVLMISDDPPAEIINGTGQYLQIASVKPATKSDIEGKPNNLSAAMPPDLQKYYLANDVNAFLFTKPFRKSNTKDKDNEFKDLWVLNRFYITEDTFPTILRRSQIVNQINVEVSPLENAYKAMKEKNIELQGLLIKHDEEKNPHPPAVQEFTMVIKGVTDALVNGGPDKYKEAFFNAEFLAENPTKKALVSALKEELLRQIFILEQALDLHKKRIGDQMADLQNLFEANLSVMKEKSKSIL
eukprot:TRINITY_DN713_c0_g1_i1.p1 TRINITY_DN713_c0_g1~~TRINITY_DN713_c0_g1_i1.p1  ORF type:complete len:1705 (+),score=520.73 TRINITY_DN713_c0_g1_i1:76-5190(+)